MIMFNRSKYTTWYYSIIRAARRTTQSGYVEEHHIIPKSMGGSNSKRNLVTLTARQHFVCHLLLTKMVSGKNKRGMAWALHRMAFSKHNNQRKFTSWEYELARK